jgi:hypothetical protein
MEFALSFQSILFQFIVWKPKRFQRKTALVFLKDSVYFRFEVGHESTLLEARLYHGLPHRTMRRLDKEVSSSL